MTYPDDLGRVPEHSTQQHFAAFRKKIASFLFGRGEHRTRLVDELDFRLANPEYGEYFDVHHEKYLTKRFFQEGRFLPLKSGDVTIVAVHDRDNYQSEFTYFVSAAYAPSDPQDPLEHDYVVLYEYMNKETETEELQDVPLRSEEAEQFFLGEVMLAAGDQSYVVQRTKLAEILAKLEAEEGAGPKLEEATIIIDHQLQLRQILKAIGYSGTE